MEHFSVGPQGLQKLTSKREPEPSGLVKALGHFLSYVFHPLFIPTYVSCFLLFIHPFVFAGYSEKLKVFRLINVIFCTAFLPALSVFIMWRLKLVISSIQLKTQRERIIPYAVSMTFYFWCWYVSRNVDSPWEMQLFLLGAFLAVCSAWMLNIPMRVSMHTTAVGAVMTFFLILAFKDPTFNTIPLSISILIAGGVCTARLLVSTHSYAEIYIGFFAGVLAQLVAIWFV
jgi:hypothetical protein